MGQVTVSLNGRTYRLRCGDGDEQRLFALTEHVRTKIELLIGEFGQIGDDRLLLMAALLVTDELFDLQERDYGTADDPAFRSDGRIRRPALSAGAVSSPPSRTDVA